MILKYEKKEKIEALIEEIKNLRIKLDTLEILALAIKRGEREEASIKLALDIWHRKIQNQSELEDVTESVKKIGEILGRLEELARPVILLPD